MFLQNCPRLDSIFYGIFHPPTHTHTAPTLFLGGLETAVPGLLYLQWKVTERFLKIDASTLWLPWERRNNSWNILPCIECVWVMDVNSIFQVPVCFFCRKSPFWQGIFLSFKCEIWKEICPVVDNYQIIMWYLFFSRIMWSHWHCGEWRGCFRCETFHPHQPMAVPLFQGKRPARIFVSCLFSWQEGHSASRDGLRSWALPGIGICGFSALVCLACRIFTCRMEEMNVLLLPYPLCLQVNELMHKQATCDCRAS